jgi:hypothetical protein
LFNSNVKALALQNGAKQHFHENMLETNFEDELVVQFQRQSVGSAKWCETTIS